MNLLRATAAALPAVQLAGCAAPEPVTGVVTGRLMSEGGRGPGQQPMAGTVAFTAARQRRVTVRVQNSGIFSVPMPPGATEFSCRYCSAIRCLRSPAVQKITGTPFAAAQALTRRANPARHPHQVRVIQQVVAAVQPPPPAPEPARIVPDREERVQHDPVHAVIGAGQQVSVPFGEVIGHADRRGNLQPAGGARP